MSWKLPKDYPLPKASHLSQTTTPKLPLSNRLATMVSLVPHGACVADIGTDHAMLPIALHHTRQVKRAIGIDIRRAPLKQAQRNIHKFNSHNAVELRQSSGLDSLKRGEADTLCFAGLNGDTILKLLFARDPEDLGIATIVIQPNADQENIRKALARRGWLISHESLVIDGERLFLVLVANKSSDVAPTYNADDLVLGPILRRNPTQLFAVWLKLQQKRLQNEIAGCHRSGNATLLGQQKSGQLAIINQAIKTVVP